MICDRYAYSGVSYSAAKGLDFDWCLNADRGLIKPDLVFYFDIDMDTIKSRSGFGDERYEKTEFQGKVRDQYMKFKELNKPQKPDSEITLQDRFDHNWVNIDANTKSIDEIHTEIVSITNEY